MSRQSNVILTNEKGIIIDTLRHFESDTRELLPAHPFTFTPILKTSFIDLETFEEFLELIAENGEENLSCKLPEIFIGFSKSFVLKSLENVGIQDDSYNDVDLEKLYNYLKDLLQKIDINKVKGVEYGKDFTVEIAPKSDNLSVNYFLDEYYFLKEQKNLFNSSKNNLLKIISGSLKKVYKKLENINRKA
jgi:predicted ribosome quality control (RQC) complex YloA/Tae2 family protein